MERCKFLAIEIIFMHTLVFAFCSVIIPNDTKAIDSYIPRIVGGSPVSIEKIPWQVSLHCHAKYVCGGSIISLQWVLTAAHCTWRMNLDGFKARVGSSRKAKDGHMINITRIVDHPNYSTRTTDYDISLLQLAETLSFTKKIQPIALPNADTEVADGTLCTTSGWGRTLNSSESEEILREVSVPIVNQQTCQELYMIKERLVLPSMICAGYVKEGGKDACQGDSGGPLINSIPQLIGIVSWGCGCARPYCPGVYARVTMTRDWITAIAGI